MGPLPRLLPVMKNVAWNPKGANVSKSSFVKLYGPSSNVNATTFSSTQSMMSWVYVTLPSNGRGSVNVEGPAGVVFESQIPY